MRPEGEAEGLQTLGIVVVLCSSLKLLHYLGLIDLSDGKRTPELPYFIGTCFSASVVTRRDRAQRSAETRRGVRRPWLIPGVPELALLRRPSDALAVVQKPLPGELGDWSRLARLCLPCVHVGRGGSLAA
ncbi:hypothetical protein VULLAG_LOCUS10256 [Vulpes lagopus]